ncbi:hypothetical protein [Salarchaeum sp. JOR-1]|uniref:DUF7097 family protein n=1 Tax=Salarchaeum sp. JOR-1 TaxID=2599399 RepID=UPI001198C327|nr:hypothetical protein [Salarchaeum sp. JOR-1]QDX39823.1 hypothetical protein FQU85_02500 [Salarchaeum sp. JOR-1]
MEKTPSGTSVGVADPYERAGVCDHVTGDGRCRYAVEHAQHDPEFAAERRADDYRCPVAADDWAWRDCPHYRDTATSDECARCGLDERRNAHSDARPLLEEHHLSYADERSESAEQASGETANSAGERNESAEQASSTDGAGELAHEITVTLCRWCHAKVHGSWAAIDDDASPDAAALAEREGRKSDELAELGFETAAERDAE